MEIWLNTNEEKIMLPVVPPSIGVDRSMDIGTESLLKIGEIPIINGLSLKTIEISSFFPSKECSYGKYEHKPYELSNKIHSWMNKGQQIRFIVTDTNINMLSIISSFSTREQDGSRDLYFDMSIMEYREPKISTIENNSSNDSNSNDERPSDNNTGTEAQKTHQVVKGDSLWAIAQKYYGKGSDYPKIKTANQDKYPSLKTSNVIYTNMTLVIP